MNREFLIKFIEAKEPDPILAQKAVDRMIAFLNGYLTVLASYGMDISESSTNMIFAEAIALGIAELTLCGQA